VFRNYIHIDLMHFIMGDVLGVADHDIWVAAIAAAIVLSVIILFFRQFQLTSFDPVMAASIGMPVVLIDYVLTTCVSLVVVSAVSMVGVILVVGLLITPAASAYLLSDRLDKMMLIAALFGVTSVVGGLYLCMWLDSSGGGAIMLFCTVQFIAVLICAPRYGVLARWMRRRRMVPEQVMEDILGALMRVGDKRLAMGDLTPLVGGVAENLSRAVKWMTRDGLLDDQGGAYGLTDAGRQEASRILRAHRLWESYLRRVGTPDDELHTRAHELEHLNDAEAVDYLDDILGHPVHDPHGAEIPGHPAECVPGRTCTISVMREGRRGVVEAVGENARSTELRPGDRIIVGPRRNQGSTWTVVRPDQTESLLDHGAADAIVARITDEKEG
jgi:manganese/iron transport system permease protein/iron/zinc/copper transport system permease protein